MKRTLGIAVVLIVAGCAATYSPSASRQAEFERTVAGSGEKLFDAAKLALTLDGYQIVSSDRRPGLISTGRRQIDLTDVETDCGTTLDRGRPGSCGTTLDRGRPGSATVFESSVIWAPGFA